MCSGFLLVVFLNIAGKTNAVPDYFVSEFEKRSCIALGGTGCENNNAKCCRQGNPYTGEMRRCINAGSFSEPIYKCVEAHRDTFRPMQDYYPSRFEKRSCVALGGTGCENNHAKCCRKGNPYTGETRRCINVGSFSGPIYKCVEANRDTFRRVQDYYSSRFEKRSCVALGGTGCENNNAKCCRQGNPYTGEMRRCINAGSFSEPIYKCVEAHRDTFRRVQDYYSSRFEKRSCVALGGTGCENSDAKCCRQGDPYTGKMRRCINAGSFSEPIYKCVEANRDTFRRMQDYYPSRF